MKIIFLIFKTISNIVNAVINYFLFLKLFFLGNNFLVDIVISYYYFFKLVFYVIILF